MAGMLAVVAFRLSDWLCPLPTTTRSFPAENDFVKTCRSFSGLRAQLRSRKRPVKFCEAAVAVWPFRYVEMCIGI